jgi:hypothetical protein
MILVVEEEEEAVGVRGLQVAPILVPLQRTVSTGTIRSVLLVAARTGHVNLIRTAMCREAQALVVQERICLQTIPALLIKVVAYRQGLARTRASQVPVVA